MAKVQKKTPKNNVAKPASKKSKQLFSFRNVLILIAVLIAGFLGYNKYLDWRNVEDMKSLLASFEQLEKDVEAETKEDLYIEASCGSVGKFSTSYSCTLDLKQKANVSTTTLGSMYENSENIRKSFQCDLYSNLGFSTSNGEDYFGCRAFKIRRSNEVTSESIFYKYDTSPGSAF